MSRFHKLDANIKAAIEEAGSDASNPEDMPNKTPDVPESEPEPVPEAQPEKEENMSDTTPVEQTDNYKAGVKAERDRHATVFASEHYAGREATALKLLGKDMSAEDVIDVLAGTPKPEAPKALTEDQQREAAEEAGRKEMKGALAESTNSNIQPGDAAKPDAANQHGDMWATAYGAKEGAK